MQWVSSHLGKLLIEPDASNATQGVGIVELIAESIEISCYPALWLAMRANKRTLIWCNREQPPYFSSFSQLMTRSILWVRGDTSAAIECLRSKAVGAMIYQPHKLSSIESRRLQLAAEQSGAIGILIRKTNAAQSNYAATARYHVAPARGDPLVQRWDLTHVHGHGRQVGETVTLELCRETNHLHLSSIPAGRSGNPQRSIIAG